MSHVTGHITSAVASGSSYVANGGAVVYGVATANEWAAFGGLFLGTLTFAYNVYHKNRMFKLEKERKEKVEP